MDVFGNMEVDDGTEGLSNGEVWNLPQWELSKDDVPVQRAKSSIGTDHQHALKQDYFSHIPFNFRGNLGNSKYNSRYLLQPTRADSFSSTSFSPASSPPSFMPSGRSSLSSASPVLTPLIASYRSSFSVPQAAKSRSAQSQFSDLHGETIDMDLYLEHLMSELRHKMKLRHRFHTWEEGVASNGERRSSKLSIVTAVSGVESQEPCQHCCNKKRQIWKHDKSLCNACGLFLQLHGVPRPLSQKIQFMKTQSNDSFTCPVDSSGSFKIDTVLRLPDLMKLTLQSSQYDKMPFSALFSPLCIDRKEIRLIELKGGEPEDDLSATLKVVSLFENQKYEAISYSRDADADKKPLILCGIRIMIDKRVTAALQRLRLLHRTRLLWVDSLCINHEDVSERQNQIFLMLRIYQNSFKILVWLGEGPGFKQPATEYTSDLGDVAVYGLQNQSASETLDNELVSELAILTISERAKELAGFGADTSEPLHADTDDTALQAESLPSYETDLSPWTSISQHDPSFSESSSVNSLEDTFTEDSVDDEETGTNEPGQIFEEDTNSLLATLEPLLARLSNDIALRLAHELRMLFDAWFESIPVSNHKFQLNDTTPGSQTANKPPQKQNNMPAPLSRQKRMLKDISEDSPDDGDDEANENRKYPRLGPKNPTENVNQRWACPYYQREPHRYCVETEHGDFRKCARSPGFREVHRVKDHIYHCHAAIYCERCYSVFRKDEDLKAHRRDPSGCQVQAPKPLEGLTDEQKQMLKPRDRNKSEEERWNTIYKICFPDDEVIPSPYYVYYSRETAELRREVFSIVEEETGQENAILRGRILQRLQRAFDHAQTVNLSVPNGLQSEFLTPSASASTSLRSSLESSVPSTQNSLQRSPSANTSIPTSNAPLLHTPGSLVFGPSSRVDHGRVGRLSERFMWGNEYVDQNDSGADLFPFDSLVDYDEGQNRVVNNVPFDGFFLRS